MSVIKTSVKYFFKTDWSKWIIILFVFISILSLGTYRDTSDFLTALLSSYSNFNFIACIFLLFGVNTLYLHKLFFNNDNYIFRLKDKLKYIKYWSLTNIIINFIYYFVLLLFVIAFGLFRVKGGIDLNIIFNYGIPGWLYFLYHYFKVFIILMIIINISKYIILLFKRNISLIFYFFIFLFIVTYKLSIDWNPNTIYGFNVLFPYYFALLNFGTLDIDIAYLLGELSILYCLNIILKNIYLYLTDIKFPLFGLKFLKLEWWNFFKDNIKYFIIFFAIEIFMILTYSLLTIDNNVMDFTLNLIKVEKDSLIILNKLFCIIFIIFISLLNFKYIYGYGKAYLALRTNNKKIISTVIASLICNLFFINLCLAILGIGISLIRGLSMNFNFNTLISTLFLEMNICLLLNFMFYKKYQLLVVLIFILIIFYLLSFNILIINVLIFLILLLCSAKLLKIKEM